MTAKKPFTVKYDPSDLQWIKSHKNPRELLRGLVKQARALGKTDIGEAQAKGKLRERIRELEEEVKRLRENPVIKYVDKVTEKPTIKEIIKRVWLSCQFAKIECKKFRIIVEPETCFECEKGTLYE